MQIPSKNPLRFYKTSGSVFVQVAFFVTFSRETKSTTAMLRGVPPKKRDLSSLRARFWWEPKPRSYLPPGDDQYTDKWVGGNSPLALGVFGAWGDQMTQVQGNAIDPRCGDSSTWALFVSVVSSFIHFFPFNRLLSIFRASVDCWMPFSAGSPEHRLHQWHR